MTERCRECKKYEECLTKYHIPTQEFADDMQYLLYNGYSLEAVKAFIAAERSSDSIVLDCMSYIIDKVVWKYENE